MVIRTLLAWVVLAGVAAAQTPVKQAVLETSMGTIVMDLYADKAPAHVLALVRERMKSRMEAAR